MSCRCSRGRLARNSYFKSSSTSRACQPHQRRRQVRRRLNNEVRFMSTTLPHPELDVQRNYLNADYGWKSWLFTTDHKRIALLYLFSITAFFFVGGAFAVAMRVNLLFPEGIFAHD